MALGKLADTNVSLGCDPEFFFSKKNSIIGAEKILPKGGLINKDSWGQESKFTIDGFAAELNPRPVLCRANMGNELIACFKLLKIQINEKGVSADFSQTVNITKEELETLDEKNRKLGCAPSLNSYDKAAGVTINGETYMKRSAGGHIHLGFNKYATFKPEPLVKILDIILGNTFVLIDRDEANIERRKIYGRAGEYRLPAHGLEYRTLSNCWLRSYPLMSLAFGLARQGYQIFSQNPYYQEELFKLVAIENVVEAINNNDFHLAMSNFNKIKPFLMEVTPEGTDRYCIKKDNIEEFYWFIEKGLDHWWPDDPMKHWINLPEAHAGGFSDFLGTTVRNSLAKSKEMKGFYQKMKEALLNVA